MLRAALRSHNRLIKQVAGSTSASYTFDAKQLRQIGESVTYATNGAPFTLASSTTDTRKGYAVVVQPLKWQQPRSNALGQQWVRLD